MLKKSPENADGRTDGRTDIATAYYVPFFKRAYKKASRIVDLSFKVKAKKLENWRQIEIL